MYLRYIPILNTSLQTCHWYPALHYFIFVYLSSLFHDTLCSCLYSVSSFSHCFISAVLNSDHILQNCSRCLVVGMLCPSPFQSLIKILTRTGPRMDAKAYKTLLIWHAHVSSPVFRKKKLKLSRCLCCTDLNMQINSLKENLGFRTPRASEEGIDGQVN